MASNRSKRAGSDSSRFQGTKLHWNFLWKITIRQKPSPLNITIKNLWKQPKNIRVKLKSATPNYTFTQKEFNFLNPKSQEPFSVSVNIEKIDRDSHFSFETSIWADGVFQGNFVHRIDISRNIEKDTNLLSFPFVFPDDWEKKEELKNVEPRTLRAHLDNIHTKPEYMILSTESKKYLELHIFRLMENTLERAGTIKIPDASVLTRVMRVDLDYDGNLDYVIVSAHTDKNKYMGYNTINLIQYSFVKHDFSPLLNQQTYQLPPGVTDPQHIYSFYKKELDNGRHVALPVLQTNGKLIESDQEDSIFSTENPEKFQKRVYYVDFHSSKPGWMEFYAFENKLFKENIRKKLNLNFYRSSIILQVLPQPHERFYTGTTDLLFALSNGNCYVLSTGYHGLLSRQAENIKAVSPDLCSYTSFGNPIREFTDKNFESNIPLAMHQIQSSALGFTSIWDSSYNLRPGSKLLTVSEDLRIRKILSPLFTFASKDSTYTLFEETDGILLLTASDSEEPVYSRFPLVKSSLLPRILFHATVSPSFFREKNGPLKPAFEVSYASITKNHLFLLTIDKNKKLYTPTKFNLHIPKHCAATHSVSWQGESMALVFYCASDQGKSLKMLPIR